MKVKELKTFESTKDPGRHYFAAEMEVLDTSSEDYREGDVVTWLVDMSKAPAMNNLLGFALALAPENTTSDITAEVMEELVSPDQPASGLTVRANAFLTKTRSGGDFTKVNWRASN